MREKWHEWKHVAWPLPIGSVCCPPYTCVVSSLAGTLPKQLFVGRNISTNGRVSMLLAPSSPSLLRTAGLASAARLSAVPVPWLLPPLLRCSQGISLGLHCWAPFSWPPSLLERWESLPPLSPGPSPSTRPTLGATTSFCTDVLSYVVAARREACATYAALIPVVVTATGQDPQRLDLEHPADSYSPYDAGFGLWTNYAGLQVLT